MTDKLMHALSTMTEIALLWNPCSDLFLMNRKPYVLPHVCPQKPTLLAPTTDTIALLSEQQHSSSAPATSTHAREAPQPSYKRARHACDGLEEFSGGQSHHLSLQNLSARSHDAAQTFDRWPRRPPDGAPPCAQHMADTERQCCRMAGKKHCGGGGQNHHVRGQLSPLFLNPSRKFLQIAQQAGAPLWSPA